MCILKSHHVSETGFLTGLKFTGWLGAGQQAPGTGLSLVQYWGYKHTHHVQLFFLGLELSISIIHTKLHQDTFY